MKFNLMKYSQIFLAIISIAAFQNCSFSIDPLASLGVAKANGNGTGYDGKAYANYGKCGVTDAVTLKSLIIENADRALIQTVDDCAALAVPKVIADTTVKRAISDESLFVYEGSIFDEVRPSLSEAKLTRVICWDEDKSLRTESAIFFAPGALLPAADRVLSAYVLDSSGESSGLISPVHESPTTKDGSLFEGSDDSGSSLSINYRSSGSCSIDYFDATNATSGTSNRGKRTTVVGCFEQRRPDKVLTLDDL